MLQSSLASSEANSPQRLASGGSVSAAAASPSSSYLRGSYVDDDLLAAVADEEALRRTTSETSSPPRQDETNDLDASQGLDASANHVAAGDSSRLFDMFQSRDATIRSLLFDDLDSMPTPANDDLDSMRALSPLMSLPPLYEATNIALPPFIPASLPTPPPMPATNSPSTLDVLPAIDAIVRDSQYLPPGVLARSHNGESLAGSRSDFKSMQFPLTSGSALPSSMALTILSRDSSLLRESRRGSTEDPGSVLFRYASPPLPSSAPIRRSVSTVDSRSTHNITPFKNRVDGGETNGSGARTNSTPNARPFVPMSPHAAPGLLRQHSSLTLQQAARDGVAPFRCATSRRASAASLSSTASPRHHPFIDVAVSFSDDAAAAYPAHLQRLKQHLDAYIAESLASMKVQLEDTARQFLLAASRPSTGPSRATSVDDGGRTSGDFAAAPSPRPSRLHSFGVGNGGGVGVPASAQLPPLSPFALHSPLASSKRFLLHHPASQLAAPPALLGPLLQRQATPPVQG